MRRAHTLLKIELFIEPPCKAEKESNEDKDCKGCAVLVEGRDIADRDGSCTGCFYSDSVGADDLFLTPTRVPLMHQQGIYPARCESWGGFACLTKCKHIV